MEKSSKAKSIIEKYNEKIESLKQNCESLQSEKEFMELFKGVIIMFIKEMILLYNKLLEKLPNLKFSSSSAKITNLNILLTSLEGDGILYGIDCTDIILRAYITYFYVKYRDDMMNWNIEHIKLLNEENIHSTVIDTASKEKVTNEVSEYLNIIPEVVLMINNLSEKDILKTTYLLNNVNVIVDVYLVKKQQKLLMP
jgi:hypothetical protein